MVQKGRVIWDVTGLKSLPADDDFYYDADDEMFKMKPIMLPDAAIKLVDKNDDTDVFDDGNNFYTDPFYVADEFSAGEKNRQIKESDR